jgi:acid phosphatase type 7
MRIKDFRRFGHFLSIAVLTGLIGLSSGRSWLAGDLRVALAAGDPVIAAAGDIACDPSSSSFNGGNGTSGSCRQRYTSDMLVNGDFAAVLALGDIQYYCGGYQAWLQSYDLSWGRVKSITRPAVGNHEYLTSGGTDCTSANAGAAGYFRYFGAAAGQPSQGYYSYNIGAWHLIALNSNCSSAGGCGSSSPQGLWLQQDLAANQNLCTLAYWHIPLFSSGGRANSNTQALWQILYNNNIEVVLNGHDHIYERFAPQAPNGTLDTVRGIREFIVGTGGSNHTSLASIAANSQVRNTDTFGILKLTLHPGSYDWQFVPEPGKTFSDSGTGLCQGSGQTIPTTGPSPTPGPLPTVTPTPPQVDPLPTTAFTFSPIADAYVNQSSPTTNYGTSTQLRTDGSPLVRSYMRFDVRNLAGRVARATLRVYASSALSVGYDVRALTGGIWSESTINYNNAPAFGSALGGSGSVLAGGWTNVDITSLITGDGIYDIALTSASGTALSLASREAAAANQPQLIVEVIDPTATPSQTDTATSSPTETASSTAAQTDTSTPTDPDTDTPTPTGTATLSDPPSDTPTATPSDTPVPTAIDPVETPTDTASPTQLQPDTETPAMTDTATFQATDSPSDTPLPAATDTETPALTATATSTPTDSVTDTPLPSETPTVLPTDTGTDTPAPTASATPSQTQTPLSTETLSPTPTATATRTATATSSVRTFTFTPAADTYVNQSSPTTNYGTSTQLRADGSPLVRGYLRFNVQNVTGRITRVTLRIYASSGASSGCVANIVNNNTWTETGMNYNNAPSPGSALGLSGSFGAGVWISMDVTAYVTGNGTYNLALTTPGSTAISLASRESANDPQLIIETAP